MNKFFYFLFFTIFISCTLASSDVYAATENLYVSADNSEFDNHFAGPMIIEVVINDNNIDESNSPEPDVTVNGANLKMVQAGDGNWYAYIVERKITALADSMQGLDYGIRVTDIPSFGVSAITTTGAEEIYINSSLVVRQAKKVNSDNSANLGMETIWPVIQAFDFSINGHVSITYLKSGNPQIVTLTFLDDPDDYAELTLDREHYPAGAHVHMNIRSLAHNIDPTDHDSWTYDTSKTSQTAGYAYYHLYDDTGTNGTGSAIPLNPQQLESLYFGDSGILYIDTNPNGALEPILEFRDNDDQQTSGTSGEFPRVDLTQQFTMLETSVHTGIFKNTDNAKNANLRISNSAPRGYTGTISYADSAQSVGVKNYQGSIKMDLNSVGGEWNPGEQIKIKLFDGDNNINSLDKDFMGIYNPSIPLPTIVTGNPITLDDVVSLSSGRIISLGENTKRALIVGAVPNEPIVATYMITFDYYEPNLFYFSHTRTALTRILEGMPDGDHTVNITLGTASSRGSLVAVGDIFSFGQTGKISDSSTTRHANAIYRLQMYELGPNSGINQGKAEYILLNQLNVLDASIYENIETIGTSLEIIVPTDLTDEDSIRINYQDITTEGLIKTTSAQTEALTHSGIVSFDTSSYKIGDTVTVTLNDVDLNTHSETIEVYTTSASTTEDLDGNAIFDRVGTVSADITNVAHGRLLDITFDDTVWSSYNCGVSPNGISDTGFTLSEINATSGIFTGTFQIPSNYCTSTYENKTTTGKDMDINYVDYSDAFGEYNEVGDSAGIRANTGSVSFDRTVYPVPFDASQYSTYWTFSNNGTNRALDVVDASITGNTIMHIRVNDPDYDVSSIGSDTLDAATLSVKIIRGSATTSNLINSNTLALEEISPTSGGIFELDLAIGAAIPDHAHNNQTAFIGTTNGMQIQQGDIITVEYHDPTDASGNPNTVTDSATFDMRNAVLQTDKPSYIIGSDMILTLIEPDFDLDSDETETYPLALIEWDSDATTVSMGDDAVIDSFDPEPSALRETGDSTGIFQTVIEIPESLQGQPLERGERIDLEYVDYGSAGNDFVQSDGEDIELTVFTSNFGAVIALDKKTYSWTDKVFVTITAPDHNFDSYLIDQIGDTVDDPIKISTRENSIDNYRLVETGTDTGIFTGEVILTGFVHDADGDGAYDAPTQLTSSSQRPDQGVGPKGPTDGYLESKGDDGVSVSFEVSEDETVLGSALIRWSIAESEWTESSYAASGTGIIRVEDPDMNINPESIDNFDVDVWSDSDPGGISLTVVETNEATGMFEGEVSFTISDVSSGHRLRISEGDTVIAEYNDHTLPDPYDYADDLDVLATTVIGSIVAPLERAPASNVRFVDTNGIELSSVLIGQQVLVSAELQNNQDRDQAYTYLIQIQNIDDVTVLLSWITGTLPEGHSSSPSQSWIPTESGEFTATVFVWNSIASPTALSPSISKTIMVN